MTNNEKILCSTLESKAKIIQGHFDELWKKCVENKWFDQAPGLKDWMMWTEHEVSRATWHMGHTVKGFKEKNP